VYAWEVSLLPLSLLIKHKFHANPAYRDNRSIKDADMAKATTSNMVFDEEMGNATAGWASISATTSGLKRARDNSFGAIPSPCLNR
jgi:hypothetical protein